MFSRGIGAPRLVLGSPECDVAAVIIDDGQRRGVGGIQSGRPMIFPYRLVVQAQQGIHIRQVHAGDTARRMPSPQGP